jgi:transcriptional regulator with XRE-family HTH domain
MTTKIEGGHVQPLSGLPRRKKNYKKPEKKLRTPVWDKKLRRVPKGSMAWYILQVMREKDVRRAEDLAEMTGVTEATIQRWLNHQVTPDGESLVCLAEALGVPLSRFHPDPGVPFASEGGAVQSEGGADEGDEGDETEGADGEEEDGEDAGRSEGTDGSEGP